MHTKVEFVCIFGQDVQVGRNLTDPLDGFLRGKRFLILDRDKKFTTEFRDLLEHAGTDVIRLPHRSPNLNAYVERFVLSIKSECLERMIFFGEREVKIHMRLPDGRNVATRQVVHGSAPCARTEVLALFAVGDVYVSLCKRGAYDPFAAQRRSRALFLAVI